ncbi:hypothetical protein JCM8547_002115 [Rhodosporidiobolus lusitaniae]
MPDSLFGSDSEDEEQEGPAVARAPPTFATSSPPPIPGLYVFPQALPVELQHQLTEDLSRSVWSGHSNQVMLFDSPTRSALHPYLQPLLALLPFLLTSLPDSLKSTIFSSFRPRQAILNLYFPGQGISPHVDLPGRYEDGIVGVSLLGSTVMDFSRAVSSSSEGKQQQDYSLRLKPGDVYVLSGEARWDWAHGIAYREEDWVEDEEGRAMLVRRGIRMSITLRRMKEGAECIGLGAEELQAEGDTGRREGEGEGGKAGGG